MEINLGTRGATRQTWIEKPLRDLVFSLVRDNPSAGHDVLVRLCVERMREDDDYLAAAADYIVTNAVNSLTDPRKLRSGQPCVTPEERDEQKSAKEAHIAEIKQRIVAVVLLDLTLPNGKLLRDATFAECAKAGGWFTKIAKKGKPGQVVGKVLSEQQLRAVK